MVKACKKDGRIRKQCNCILQIVGLLIIISKWCSLLFCIRHWQAWTNRQVAMEPKMFKTASRIFCMLFWWFCIFAYYYVKCPNSRHVATFKIYFWSHLWRQWVFNFMTCQNSISISDVYLRGLRPFLSKLTLPWCSEKSFATRLRKVAKFRYFRCPLLSVNTQKSVLQRGHERADSLLFQCIVFILRIFIIFLCEYVTYRLTKETNYKQPLPDFPLARQSLQHGLAEKRCYCQNMHEVNRRLLTTLWTSLF
jgi:hypothetical protein